MVQIVILFLLKNKVVSVFKKDSELDYSKYCPITLLLNIEKILEKLMCKSENITENIGKALGEGNIGCGVFVNLQKALHALDHQILSKLNHHEIRRISNDWFKSYLSYCSQFVSMTMVLLL